MQTLSINYILSITLSYGDQPITGYLNTDYLSPPTTPSYGEPPITDY